MVNNLDKVELISLSTLPLQSFSNHHIIGRGKEYATARLASREESRVQAQIARQKALMKEFDVPTSSKSTSTVSSAIILTLLDLFMEKQSLLQIKLRF